MSRGRRPFALVLLLVLTAVAGRAATGAGGAHEARLQRVVEDSLLFARGLGRSNLDSVQAVLRHDVADVRRAGDAEVLRRLLRFQGIALVMAGDAAGAVAPLDEGLRLAEAQRDTAVLLACLRWRAYASGVQGRFADQERMAKRLLLIAERRRDTRYQAIAHNFLGWIEHRLGDHRRALYHLERAVQQHRANRSFSDEAVALTALGSTQMALGQYDAARASYQREIVIARATNQLWSEAEATNDLGVLENQIGDPARAAQHFRHAYAMHRRLGETIDAVDALSNLAASEIQLGRSAEAVRQIREGIEICERRGFALPLGSLLNALADAEASRGRPAAADSARQRVLDRAGDPDVGAYVWAVLGRAASVEFARGPAEALLFLQRWRMQVEGRTTRIDEVRLDASEARLLLLNGRADDAVQLARRSALEAEAIGFLDLAVSGWRTVAQAEAAAGHSAEARFAFEHALAAWEAHRRKPTEPEWRERRGSEGAGLGVEYVRFVLTEPSARARPDRIAEAFGLVQRVKTRTLIERMSGPHAFTPDDSSLSARPASLRAIQDSTLRDGELLVEWLVAEDGAYRFAIRRDRASVDTAAGLRELQTQIQAVRGQLASRPQGRASVDDAALRALSQRMWSGLESERADARRVIVAPDGPVHLVPFAALEDGGAAYGPLALVPSATVLADIRRRTPAPQARGMLACAPPGDRLAGARGEVSWLAARFQDVATASSDTLEMADLAMRRALHLAGHSRVDDHYPWRSSIGGLDGQAGEPTADTLDRAADSSGAGRRGPLRAEDIAAGHLDADLVVLSSCATAGGRVVTGEGVAGLATAFLAAGAPTVLATLWPVDDRATERFMREFYRALGAGRGAGDALADAQAVFRRDPELRHPFYWAGYVILGDGETRIALRPKATGVGWWAGLAGLALAAGSWLVARRRRVEA